MARLLRESTRVANGGWNLLRDSDSRCLGSNFSDSSPGDIAQCRKEGTGNSLAEGYKPPLSLSFTNESKAARLQLWFHDQETVSLLCASFKLHSFRHGLLTLPCRSWCRCRRFWYLITRYILWLLDVYYYTACDCSCVDKTIAKVKSILLFMEWSVYRIKY